MKTNVIQLEVHDDVISIKDKMAWQSCQRMILVWPKHGKVLHNELELVLLNREAKSLGADLVLVTHHPLVREWAYDSNLPLYASISAAEKAHWNRNTQINVRTSPPKGVEAIKAIKAKLPQSSSSNSLSLLVKVLSFLVSLSALIALIMVIIPSTKVTFFPATTQQEVQFQVKASEVFAGINPSGSIPAKAEFVEVSAEKSMPSSGKVLIPTTKAVGELVFTNLTTSVITMPAGTLFISGDQKLVSFNLVEEVVVPAGVNDSAQGKVEALIAGPEGNLAAESTWTLSGGMDTMVSVTNPEPFTGGNGVETPAPNDEDYADLERQLLVELMSQGLDSLQSNKVAGVELIVPSLTIDKILSNEQINKIGFPADEAVMRLNVRLKVYTYQLSDLEAIAEIVMTSNQPHGFVPLDNQITLKRKGDFRVDDFGQASWTISASRVLVPDWNIEKTAIELTGMKIADAKSTLLSLFQQTRPVEIKRWLGFWPWMPFLSTNIHFVNGVIN